MRYITPDQPLPPLTLANDADVEALAGPIAQADVVALTFPKWVDGRAYSQAALLRRRLGFKGEMPRPWARCWWTCCRCCTAPASTRCSCAPTRASKRRGARSASSMKVTTRAT